MQLRRLQVLSGAGGSLLSLSAGGLAQQGCVKTGPGQAVLQLIQEQPCSTPLDLSGTCAGAVVLDKMWTLCLVLLQQSCPAILPWPRLTTHKSCTRCAKAYWILSGLDSSMLMTARPH